MPKKQAYSLLIVLAMNLSCSTLVFGYDEEVVHPKLTEKALNASNLDSYLKTNFGSKFQGGIITALNGKPIVDLFTQGSTAEDDPRCQATNHFHNPLLPWNASQMSDDIIGLAIPISLYCNSRGWPYYYRRSNVTWATGYLSPSPEGLKHMFLPDETTLPINWDIARARFYSALTDKNGSSRDADIAETFNALGHIMHLIQDMAVPAHVRNDFQSHLIRVKSVDSLDMTKWYSNPFELFVKDNTRLVTAATITTPSFENKRLTDFWDTDTYNGSNPSTSTNVGLAEFTNANYFSDYTIPNNGTTPEHTFPYPHIGNSNVNGPNYQICSYQFLGGVASVNYISRTNRGSCPTTAGTADHFAVASLMNIPGASDINSISHIWLGDDVHEQYSRELLPRAIGYSAALIDYFFRGTLDVAWPSVGVYSIADGSKTPYADIHGNKHQQFTKIKAAILNTTTNEAIGAGTLTAVARYKMIPKYAPDLSNYPPDGMTMKSVTEYSYSVSKDVQVSNGAIDSYYYTDFTFDFSNAPIPAGITDLTLQVVFKGTIGNETVGAIAVGMRDISEPTHMTIWNLTDMYSIKYGTAPYTLYTFGAITAKAASDSNFRDLLDTNGDHSLDDELYLKPVTASYNISFWNGWAWGNPIVSLDIPAGQHIRMIVLADPGAFNNIAIDFDDHIEPGTIEDPFIPAVHQLASDGIYDITAAHTFRTGYSSEKQMVVPILQHFSEGTVGCTPQQTRCPYPDETALEVSITPIPFTSIFE